MGTTVPAAAVQMNSSLDKRANLATAVRLIAQAAQDGARLVVLPELFTAYGKLDEVVQQAETIPGPTSERLAGWASQFGVYLCAGSLCEKSETPGKGYNTSLLFDPAGRLRLKYRKLHLFNVDLPGVLTVRESDHLLPGEGVAVVPTPLGKLGTAICYDLRFPAVFSAYAERGLEVLLFPSAFTAPTGKDHWEVLLRARAIESQAFIVAANQAGNHGGTLTSYGHSLICDPWGRILAQAGDELETIVAADLELDLLADIRQRLPALQHRRKLG